MYSRNRPDGYNRLVVSDDVSEESLFLNRDHKREGERERVRERFKRRAGGNYLGRK